MTKPKVIATGRTAEVYTWGPGRILKLYHSWTTAGEAEMEAERVQAVVAAGVNTPNALEVISHDEREGIVFERVDGSTLTDVLVIGGQDWERLARQMAELHVSIHAHTSTELAPLRERLRRKIRRGVGLRADQKEVILDKLAGLPDGDQVCHNDFHPDNILVTDRGLVPIDWVDAARGNPLADIARTVILMRFASLPKHLPRQVADELNRQRHRFLDAYLHTYEVLRPFSPFELQTWSYVVAAARLDERLDDEETSKLLSVVGTGLFHPRYG
jgi:Ser/Thr protein kinase RdoA (MazF antagonist)